MLIFNGNDDQYDEKAFVPVEIKAGKNIYRKFSKLFFDLGDAILIHGQVVHKSEQSKSIDHYGLHDNYFSI
jgi:hypothetical protein